MLIDLVKLFPMLEKYVLRAFCYLNWANNFTIIYSKLNMFCTGRGFVVNYLFDSLPYSFAIISIIKEIIVVVFLLGYFKEDEDGLIYSYII